MIRKNRCIVLFWLLLFCFVSGCFMVRTVRNFSDFVPAYQTLHQVHVFIWLNWSSKIYPGLAELGQQICDTSVEQGACFSCTVSEGQHVCVCSTGRGHWLL